MLWQNDRCQITTRDSEKPGMDSHRDIAAVVAGAGTDLGRATVRALVGAGARVYAVDSARALDDVDVEGDVVLVPAEVTDADEMESAIWFAELDAGSLDVIVSCTGEDGPAGATLTGAFTTLVAGTRRLAQRETDADGWRGLMVTATALRAPGRERIDAMCRQAAIDMLSFGVRVRDVAPDFMGAECTQVSRVMDAVQSHLAGFDWTAATAELTPAGAL